MKALIAAGLMLLTLSPPAQACDTYDPTTNQLTIPIGVIDTTVYTNVVITVGSVLTVGNGPASSSYDTYTPATNQMLIPCVQVGNQTFTNVTITVGSLIGVGAVYPAPASGPPVLQLFDPLPQATVGQAYTTNLVAGIFPASTYTFAIDTLANGVLPSGMTIHLDGTLSGTPFATGRTDINGQQLPNTYTFGVCAIDTFSRFATHPCPQTTITVNPAAFALTTSTVGSGTVSADPAGPTYSPGTVVTLTATPETGSTFSGWSGACAGTGACTITMNSDASVTATFSTPPVVETCTNGATDYPACTPPAADNECKICSFDVYCSVFGWGGCWTCTNSTYSGDVCLGEAYGTLVSPGHCVTDPAIYTICN